MMKTPFQLNCKLHNILMPLHIESADSCNRSGVEIFNAEKHLERLCIFVFRREGKSLLTLPDDHIFQPGN